MNEIFILQGIGGYFAGQTIGYFATKEGAEAKLKELDPRENPEWPHLRIKTVTLEA